METCTLCWTSDVLLTQLKAKDMTQKAFAEPIGMNTQRTLRLLWWLVLLLCFVPMIGRGNDAQGNYVALGFGSETCQTFLQARSNGLDMAYRRWVTGYLTAINRLTKETVDMRGTTDIHGILLALEQYCIQHRQPSFSRAVESLVTELYPKRMTRMPHAPWGNV